MKLAGSKSWRVGVSHGDQALHVGLYIRDHFQIVAIDRDVPPSLNRQVPIGQIPIELQTDGDLPGQWLWWWRQLVHVEGHHQLGTDPSNFDALGTSQDPPGGPRFFDPYEGFQSLDSHPQLKDLVSGSWSQSNEWSKNLSQPAPKRGGTVARDVAEMVIADYEVSPERVNAGVIVLSVHGHWSAIVSPGVLLCSDSTYADDSRIALELKRTFESQLDETHQ